MLNIYQYHNDPTKIHGHEKRNRLIPPKLALYILSGALDDDEAYEYEGGEKEIAQWQSQHLTNDELLNAVCRDADVSYDYAVHVLKGPFHQGENIIASKARTAFAYAKDVLHEKPFKLGEPAIATDSLRSLTYARDILHGRFKLGEKAIATNEHDSISYASNVIKQPFKLGEPAIIAAGPPYPEIYNRKMVELGFDAPIKG